MVFCRRVKAILRPVLRVHSVVPVLANVEVARDTGRHRHAIPCRVGHVSFCAADLLNLPGMSSDLSPPGLDACDHRSSHQFGPDAVSPGGDYADLTRVRLRTNRAGCPLARGVQFGGS